MRKLWVGKYLSDMDYTGDMFDGSLTYYGNNEEDNCCCYSRNEGIREYDKDIFINFLTIKIDILYTDSIFIFYNQSYALELISKCPYIASHVYCVNKPELIQWLSNKTFVRVWLSNHVPVPPFCIFTGNECTLNNFKQSFPYYDTFIIQDNFSSGGTGTYIFHQQNERRVKDNLLGSNTYLVSPYLSPSYSVNFNAIISNENTIIFPPSIQIILEDDSKLIFCGSDYIAVKSLPDQIQNELYRLSTIIARRLADSEYKGICGFDFLVTQKGVYFIEINSRFQGSSLILNRVLMENGYSSLYELNGQAFENKITKKLIKKIQDIDITYSYRKVKNHEELINYQNLISNSQYIDKIYLDGCILKFISSHNMVSINPEGNLNIYQNLLFQRFNKFSLRNVDSWINLKILLFLQGVCIHPGVQTAFEESGGIKEGTFDAVDLRFPNGIIINCPLKIPFHDLTPFTVNFFKNTFLLYYYEEKISQIYIEHNEVGNHLLTHSGISYEKLVQQTNDRLRIRHNSICIYKRKKQGCRFCHMKNMKHHNFNMEDLKEAVSFYIKKDSFRHFMIGGASNDRNQESKIIQQVLRIVRSMSDKPIYIMSLPPQNINSIKTYRELGADEISFNMEVFDDATAKKLMPGKGLIPRAEYLLCLKEATNYFKEKGNVRSMLLIGLEKQNTFLEGIRELCKIGVSPMISIFRPMSCTELQNYVPPVYDYCRKIYDQVIEICNQYEIRLAPTCIPCQNNTVNFPELLTFGGEADGR